MVYNYSTTSKILFDKNFNLVYENDKEIHFGKNGIRLCIIKENATVCLTIVSKTINRFIQTEQY